jgi:hypothetical protein
VDALIYASRFISCLAVAVWVRACVRLLTQPYELVASHDGVHDQVQFEFAGFRGPRGPPECLDLGPYLFCHTPESPLPLTTS